MKFMPLDQKDIVLDKTFAVGDYQLRFVKNDADLNEVLRLRFDVFNLELGEGLEESYITRRDEDPFDSVCHHLMVVHKPTSKVIGTYRMQTQSMAQHGVGWYSAGEFDFSAMPSNILDEGIELGRACIDQGHRNSPVLFLLWKGVAWYLWASGKRYLFGCCSINSQDPMEGQKAFVFLKQQKRVSCSVLLHAKADFDCGSPLEFDEKTLFVDIPKLFRAYMNYGSKVCSYPAIDKAFKTIDFLMLFDFQELDQKVRQFFTWDFNL